jgi:hypothetical protein
LEDEDVRESAVLHDRKSVPSLAIFFPSTPKRGGIAYGGNDDSVHGAADPSFGVLLLETLDPGGDRVIFLGLVLALAAG